MPLEPLWQQQAKKEVMKVAEEKKEFWRWLESRWTAPDKDWREATIVTAGVDVGSVSSQAVIMCDGELYAYSNQRTGADSPDSANRAMAKALEGTGMKLEDIQYCIGDRLPCPGSEFHVWSHRENRVGHGWSGL